MIAIFKTGGKQYCVKPGQILKVEKIEGEKGDNLYFNDILAVNDNSKSIIGNPVIKGASIEAKILDQIRDKKIIVFKKRRRQNYRLTQGHRQYLTVLKIESISHGDKKAAAPKLNKKANIIEAQNKKIEKSKKKTIVKKVVSKKETKKKQVNKKKLVKKIIKSKK